ncbi:YjbH domain-containing protein [Tropicimonas sp.]|uniref:YjbH domain-containing protein n=1 Tax=Tropicimonas sp. TaxID=2067044 RepID=UPI003A8567D5
MPQQERRLVVRATAAAIVVCGAAGPIGSDAEPMVTSSYNYYGVPGLVEMPTAEGAPDGEFSASYSDTGNQRRTTLAFQIAPRISGAFRYASIPDFEDSDYYDRSFDIRLQVMDESRWLPAVAIGLQDFLGTGIYSSEYIVATKTFWDKVRITGGLGWGRLGTHGEIASFGDRNLSNVSTGGDFNFESWFSGPMAAFGGASWDVTEKLTAKAEYSSDAYLNETGQGLMDYDSPWNFGAEYRFNEGVSASVAYLYGSEFAFQLRFTLNPKKPLLGPGNEPGPLPVQPRPSRSANPGAWAMDWVNDPADLNGIETAIDNSLAKEGIRLEAIALEGSRVEIRIDNRQYYENSQALGRTARILSRALPPSVETFVITQVTGGVPAGRVTIARSDIERFENAPVDQIFARADFSDAPGKVPPGMEFVDGVYPETDWYFGPYLAFGLFDPDEPIRGDLGLRLGGSVTLTPGLVATGIVKYRLIGNTEDGTDTRPDNSVPVVRTDFRDYSKHSDFYLDELTLAHFGRPASNIYSRVTAGVLERMYTGLSGEVLWKPVDSRLAFGAELNYVVKRDYEGWFGLDDYDVVTGHLSGYYEFADGYYAQIDAGRYLAGDYGASLRLNRQFDNGWKIGAYATFTDIPFDDFGDGSFDKGLFVQVPLSWITGQPSKSTRGFSFRTFTADGGQRVSVDNRLYERVRKYHEPVIEGSSGRFWR